MGRGKDEEEEYIVHIRRFLSEGIVPTGEKDKEDLIREADKFLFDNASKGFFSEGVLLRKIREGVIASYIEFEFRGDLMQKIHDQYGHLGYQSLQNVYESRAWWPSMARDLKAFIATCPNCQIQQRQRKSQEKEEHQIVSNEFIQPFQRWGIDLIGQLPKTPAGNR
jgi:hypothetical protein